MHAQVVLFDGFDPLDAVAPYEVLFAAGSISSGALSVELVTAEGPRMVRAGSGDFVLGATGTLDPSKAQLVVVPGASGRIGGDDFDEHASNEAATDTVQFRLAATLRTDLPARLGEALAMPDVLVATVCGGSLILAMAGLIEGRHAVTHHMGMDLLDATGVHAIDARVVDDGDLVTGAGVTSGLDLGLHLVERLLGPGVARQVELLFAYERRGIVWRKDNHPEGVATARTDAAE